jgi:hypothetical protein
MEVFFIIVVLVIFIIINSSQNKTVSDKIERIDKKINAVYKEVIKIQKGGVQPTTQVEIKTEVKTPIIEKPVIQDPTITEKVNTIPVNNSEKDLEDSINKLAKQKQKELNKAKEESVSTPIEEKQPVLATSAKTEEVKTVIKTETTPPQKEKKETDFERIVGENILNKIGIGILILGIGFFVKYAIDKNYINELGRVLIGVAFSSILFGFAYFLKKSYRAFSSVLAGGAIAVLYYTITIAYQDYEMLSQPVAFIIMIGITCFSTFLAVKFDRKELAIIGLIGGFTSPFMVSGESNNYIAFFTYLTILNIGMLTLAYFKKWNIINLLSYVFTVLLFGGWLTTSLSELDNLVTVALIFATIFYAIFYSANLIYTIRKKEKFEAGQFISLLSTTIMYFSAGMVILNYHLDGKFQGLFTILLASANLLIALIVLRKTSIDKNLFYLVLSKAIVLISLFAPIQLNSNYISIFWLVETTVLIWISQRTKMTIFKHISVIVFVFACLSLFTNWVMYYGLNSDPHAIFINSGFLTSVVAVISYIISIFLLRKEEQTNSYLFFSTKGFSATLKIWLGFIAYLALLFELNKGIHIELDTTNEGYPFSYWSFGSSVKALINYGYHFLVVAVILISFKKNKNELLKILSFAAIGILTLLYITDGNRNAIDIRNIVLQNQANSIWVMLRYSVNIFMIGSIILFYIKYIKGNPQKDGVVTTFYVFFVVWSVYLLSIELDHIAVFTKVDFSPVIAIIEHGTSKILSFTQKAGYSILWGICSFVFMYIGMKNKITTLRILSLALFFVTIIKLLLFDLYNMSNIGRYISFIGLGILLLVVSFMYQRLRKLINDGK